MLNRSVSVSPSPGRKHRLLAVVLATITISIIGCRSDTIVAPEAVQSDPIAVTAEKNAAAAAPTTSLVYTFPGGPDQMLIDGASASLVRTKNGVNYHFATNSLVPGHAYTLWVVIFNDPANCGTAPDTCTPPDLFNNATQPDMLYGTGLIASGAGTATFAGRTKVGDVSGSVQAPAGIYSNGLLDPFGAEFHFVVHDHGPKNPAFMPDMIKTLAGGCTDPGIPAQGESSPWNDFAMSADYGQEYGRLGPNACQSVQFAILSP